MDEAKYKNTVQAVPSKVDNVTGGRYPEGISRRNVEPVWLPTGNTQDTSVVRPMACQYILPRPIGSGPQLYSGTFLMNSTMRCQLRSP